MSGINRLRWLVAVAGFMVMTVGCSQVKTYPNTLPKNMQVTTKLNSGSVMTSTIAEFDIHRVNGRCETDYQGRVYLDDGESTEVGVATGDLIWLDFIFASKRFLSSDISAVRYDTLLTPRSGYDYKTKVVYKNGIYNVIIRETSRDGRTVNTIKRRPLGSCKPAVARKE